MIGQYLGEKLRQGAILDLGARWFRTRAGLREEDRRTEHGHWDRANRSWRFHSHSDDQSSKGSSGVIWPGRGNIGAVNQARGRL